MRVILLSGGSGKRLWPLSNDSRSKQFLKILKTSSGAFESMVQRVWRQLGETNLQHLAYVTTSKGQFETIQGQLGKHVPIIVEPETRDTFPAIALSAAYLYSVAKVDLNETIVVLPVDPFVESHFFEKIKELKLVLEHSGADLALLGVKPTFASEKYGYIIPETRQSDLIKVEHFIEKPQAAMAQELLEKGALWNCGVFGFKLNYFIDIMKEKNIPLDYVQLIDNYMNLPKISFDYEVLEKANKIVAAEYSGYWKDLGTWNTLTEEMGAETIGNVILSPDSHNTHVINELGMPVTVIGIENAVIAASPDGILVTDKSSSPRIKQVMQHYQQRPMYEERRWGYYKVLDYSLSEGLEMMTKRIRINQGMNLSYHFHTKRSEVWTILHGEGLLIVDGEYTRISTGNVVQFNPGQRHSVKALSNLDIIEVQVGSELVEQDIQRHHFSWDDIIKENPIDTHALKLIGNV